MKVTLRQLVEACQVLDSDCDTPWLSGAGVRDFRKGMILLERIRVDVPWATVKAVERAHWLACNKMPAQKVFE